MAENAFVKLVRKRSEINAEQHRYEMDHDNWYRKDELYTKYGWKLIKESLGRDFNFCDPSFGNANIKFDVDTKPREQIQVHETIRYKGYNVVVYVTYDAQKPRLIYKIFFPHKAINNNLVESFVSVRILRWFVENKITPHIPNVIGNVNCPNMIRRIRDQLSGEALAQFDLKVTQMKKLVSHDFPPNATSVQCKDKSVCDINELTMAIITEEVSPGKISLYDYHRYFLQQPGNKKYGLDHAAIPMEFLAIYWQVLYTLEVFNRMGLRHNNLNSRNIFIAQYPEEQRVYKYVVDDGTEFYVPSRLVVHITDFNMATVTLTEGFNDEWEKINTFIEDDQYNIDERTESFCQAFGICNDFNPKFDTFKFLCIVNDLFSTHINGKVSSAKDSFSATMNRFVSKDMLDQSKDSKYSCYPPKEFLVPTKDQPRIAIHIPDQPTEGKWWMLPTFDMLFDTAFNLFKSGGHYHKTFLGQFESFNEQYTFQMPKPAPNVSNE